MVAFLFLISNLAGLTNNMVNQSLRVLQPNILRFVCFVSSIVGLLCYALISSFNHLFGNWNFFKVFLYSLFSFIICLAILLANRCHILGTNLPRKAHLVFLVFIITTVYSFFFDKANGKPDLYNLISCAAFAIMSLCLSKQIHLGFEVDLLYFFCGFLTLQLMKIKLFLVIVGASFSYFLIMLRFYLASAIESGNLGLQIQDQHSVVIQVQTDLQSAPIINFDSLQENRDLGPVTEVNLQSKKVNSDSGYITILDNCKERIVEMNKKLNRLIWQQVIMMRQTVLPDANSLENTFKIKEIEDIADDLHRIVKNMLEIEFNIESCNMYNIFRSKFIKKCLYRLGLQEVNLCDVKNENIGSLITAFNIAVKTLLPNERMIWHRVFTGFSNKYCIFSSLEWKRIEIELWAKFIVLETRIYNNYPRKVFIGANLDRHIFRVMKCIEDISEDTHNKTYIHIPTIIQLLESNLDAKFKNNVNPDLGYLFMLNNIQHIHQVAIYDPLRTNLGEDWIEEQFSKVNRNIEDYLRFSWRKVMNSMKNIESNVSNNDAIESMRLFHQRFADICHDQSRCYVNGVGLSKTMRMFLNRMFLPRYEIFIERFKGVLGMDDADQYIKYGMSDIEDRINHLFPSEQKKKEKPAYIIQYTRSTMNERRLEDSKSKYPNGVRKRV